MDELLQEIEGKFLALMRAWERKDEDALNDLMAADAVFFSEIIRKYRLNRNEFKEALLYRFTFLPGFKYEILHTASDSEKRTVVMQTKLSLPLPGISHLFAQYLVTDVWVKETEVWRLLTRQLVSLD